MELIARDRRVGQLAQIAELRYDAADLVVLLYGSAYRLVGDINAVDLGQRLENVLSELIFIVLIGGLRCDKGTSIMLMKNFGFCSLTSPMMSKYSCARCIIWQVSDENMADRKL